MDIDYGLAGKKIVITGGTRGIGRAIVRSFLEVGAAVISTGTTPETIAKAKQEDLDNSLYGVKYVLADFADPSSTKTFLRFVEEQVDLFALVNNAGIGRNNPIDEVNDDDLERLLTVNLKTPIQVCRAAARTMQRRGTTGRIVNLGSIWGTIGKPGRSVYGGTKGGLSSFTRHIASDLGPSGILVNSLSPGFTRTELTETMLTPAEIQELSDQVPLKRLAEPIEIAKVVRFLSSKENTFITGQDIVVDGGFTVV